MTDIGTRLRARRKAASMSIVALVGAADVDASRIGAIERGEAIPTMYECHALEQALPTCSPRELGRLQYGDDYGGFGFDPE
jgi:transcriptional regulator with XRE-family HTH domain